MYIVYVRQKDIFHPQMTPITQICFKINPRNPCYLRMKDGRLRNCFDFSF